MSLFFSKVLKIPPQFFLRVYLVFDAVFRCFDAESVGDIA